MSREPVLSGEKPRDYYALDGSNENDEPIAGYCDASGANDEGNPEPGWPRLRNLVCPAWRSRS